MMLSLFSLQALVLATYLFFMIRTSHANTLGSPVDWPTQAIYQECMNDAMLYNEFGGNPGFGFGQCPGLINCVLANSSEASKAGMSAGSNIAALIPTMLALIGDSVPALIVYLLIWENYDLTYGFHPIHRTTICASRKLLTNPLSPLQAPVLLNSSA